MGEIIEYSRTKEEGVRVNLPIEFIDRMKVLLKEEYADFISSFDKETYKGIRVNTLKISVEEYLKVNPFDIKEIPWIKEGFYINEDEARPGKHPYYHCGLYYIQEPSAMIPVEVLDPQPGDKVLDVSAAPGGKSTQIGAKLKNRGVLVANDISPKRVKPLAKNIELFGIKNSIVTNESPEALSKKFENYFDKILVDAPCSGEGMFRRDPKGIKSWGQFSVTECCGMQREILKSIPNMLKAGGKLVYSTCTFSPEENEGTIEWFLDEFPDFEVEEIKNMSHLDRGRPEWISGKKQLEGTRRAWPHKIEGDGHFVALLRKKDGKEGQIKEAKYKTGDISKLQDFIEENLNIRFDNNLHSVGDRVFLMPEDLPDMSGIRLVNSGLYLGEIL